ncbi:FMN-dependent dehydrogenase, includes L-lactate dehydrogenase and type II isopentenyl diphosphate isomerase [Streptoalloteichus tenebrarius]|uniref:FMN-dependent dehydrogenase, includes L-lactate dehydrogenase and type II isopentenyl diphosphate isomerase n=1 Tax=Streptoalloteichus tenebrarius (strain ATCC 17920 / DSM 40477 / JCM 4838 / CBS 697.72 / NBRC 16177 / NCIMB 11028 / NRRL B-12390 / A12253. 1 / ISP 5477) TaxID=1933 RepID=A0ABT1HRE9_STRSD|nr:alpha-hydroxy-acid oxidizing protein [Streptoalloteichus tenebrarius]MCP2258096.1 FMN-dependent dehydrogenase, includes L-lactate dehydrogenase and type II isopentenyl diphosphate isomerase [Streptoalloteichus tenebrarius]BFF01770.1 lactate 2-monooxygenase [Streptoalloteichus tenebrarius]
MAGHFGDFQLEIYLRGAAGERPELPITYDELESAARGAMSTKAFAYVAGGAGSERTLRANRAAFDRWRLVPRMVRSVTERQLATEVLGTTMAAPVLLAPVGTASVIHPEAERAQARAAADLGLVSVLSTASSTPMEEVAATAPDAARWFQLYWPNDPELAESLVRRAEAAGYRAIVVTVDTWTMAWRPRDLALGHLPFLHGHGLGNYFSDPVFRSRLAAPPEAGEEARRAAVLAFTGLFGNPSLTWADLAMLRSWTAVPVLVKGICHPDDARAALDAGADGVIVSNHGGRQVDGARAALDCLVDVADAVAARGPVLFDSGIRSGADVLVALALGADAVLVGRLWAYGLALAGHRGVVHALRALLAELDLTMGLAGYRSPADLDRKALSHDR